MFDRSEPILKAVTLGLVVLCVIQAAAMARRINPLRRTSVPAVPTWSPASATNAPGRPGPASSPSPSMGGMPGMGMGMGGPGMGGPALPPEAQGRLDRVVQSEVLGMVMRPPPMALLGILGEDVLLRAPNGMAGLVREGGELGGAKILRIGTNRVLVRVEGQDQELTIFNGMGGESLLPKDKQGTP